MLFIHRLESLYMFICKAEELFELCRLEVTTTVLLYDNLLVELAKHHVGVVGEVAIFE